MLKSVAAYLMGMHAIRFDILQSVIWYIVTYLKDPFEETKGKSRREKQKSEMMGREIQKEEGAAMKAGV